MKELKKGYTTGACAAAAAKAAAEMIFSKVIADKESIVTPAGIKIELPVQNAEIYERSARCSVKKYSGDDPDVTNGLDIYARVALNDSRINIDGGRGVGRITKRGLQQEIGQAAINKVPLRMIEDSVREVLNKNNFCGGADIIIEVPQGEEIAKKTFNPRLGIEGGISILGTSGIIEPMSRRAFIDAAAAEMKYRKENYGDSIIIAPGNYGIDFMKNYGINIDNAVKCGNFVGEVLDEAVKLEFKSVLLIGHIGKFVKLAGGIMDTHSRNADSRLEIICSNTVAISDNIEIARAVLKCSTTDEAMKILKDNDLCESVMKEIIKKADFYVKNRTHNEIESGIVMFSNKYGILGMTENAEKLIRIFRKDGL